MSLVLQHFVQREENQTKATTTDNKPLSTVGIDISYLVFEGKLDGKQKKVEFRTWDFAGQVFLILCSDEKLLIDLHREKTGFLHMRKQRRRSASR